MRKEKREPSHPRGEVRKAKLSAVAKKEAKEHGALFHYILLMHQACARQGGDGGEKEGAGTSGWATNANKTKTKSARRERRRSRITVHGLLIVLLAPLRRYMRKRSSRSV